MDGDGTSPFPLSTSRRNGLRPCTAPARFPCEAGSIAAMLPGAVSDPQSGKSASVLGRQSSAVGAAPLT